MGSFLGRSEGSSRLVTSATAAERLWYSTPYLGDFLAAQPFLLQQVNNQLVHDFPSQQNTRLFLFLSELAYGFICGWPRPVAADQPKNLTEGHPPL